MAQQTGLMLKRAGLERDHQDALRAKASILEDLATQDDLVKGTEENLLRQRDFARRCFQFIDRLYIRMEDEAIAASVTGDFERTQQLSRLLERTQSRLHSLVKDMARHTQALGMASSARGDLVFRLTVATHAAERAATAINWLGVWSWLWDGFSV